MKNVLLSNMARQTQIYGKFLIATVFFLLGLVYYLWFRVSSLENTFKKSQSTDKVSHDIIYDVGRCNGLEGDPLTNPYIPPIKCDAGSLMPTMMSLPRNAIPINIPTQNYNSKYSQVGIITKQFANNSEILPLMGRRTVTSRDKWQYYTVSGGGAGGNLQAKLPVKIKGRNCSGEYGCEEISNGDEVFVEGYRENFRATIYENGLFSYIP